MRCRMGGCKDDSENSPDSCKNGQVQIMVNSIPFHPTLQPISLELTLLTSMQPCGSCNISHKTHDCHHPSLQPSLNIFFTPRTRIPCLSIIRFCFYVLYQPSFTEIKSCQQQSFLTSFYRHFKHFYLLFTSASLSLFAEHRAPVRLMYVFQ